MKEYMNNEKKTKKKNMLRKKRKTPDYYEELFKKEAKRCCMNHLMKNNEMGYNTLCSFFENGRNGIVLKSDNNFDIPFLFTKRCFEFSDVFPDELGLIKLEGNWKIDFFGSDLKILKKLDFTNCNTYEKEGGCIYEKAENGTKKLVFEF